jgi:hypothetical protein
MSNKQHYTKQLTNTEGEHVKTKPNQNHSIHHFDATAVTQSFPYHQLHGCSVGQEISFFLWNPLAHCNVQNSPQLDST